jgi:hypothetical protein
LKLDTVGLGAATRGRPEFALGTTYERNTACGVLGPPPLGKKVARKWQPVPKRGLSVEIEPHLTVRRLP